MNNRKEDKLMELVDSSATNHADELEGLRKTFAALDAWEAPEPSPWFDARMAALLREEVARQPEGFFARLRSRFLFGSSYTMKPLLGSAMALLLVLAGGSYGVEQLHHRNQVSVAVQDLQRLDSDATALQQMDQIIDDASDDTGTPQS